MGPIFRGIKQSNCIVNFRDFPYNKCMKFGLVSCNDPEIASETSTAIDSNRIEQCFRRVAGGGSSQLVSG